VAWQLPRPPSPGRAELAARLLARPSRGASGWGLLVIDLDRAAGDGGPEQDGPNDD